MSFNGFRDPYQQQPPGGHDRCSDEAKEMGRILSTTGYLECEG